MSEPKLLDALIAEEPLPPAHVGDPLPTPAPQAQATAAAAPAASAPMSSAAAPASASGARSARLPLAHPPPASSSSSLPNPESSVYRAVSSYRAAFRAQNIPASYSVWRHFGLILAFGGAAVLVTGWLAGGPRAMLSSGPSLALMLFAFALANYLEYSAHRYKLHDPRVHTRHSHTHHRFFTDRVMAVDSFRDAHAVFFPEKAPLFLMCGALPVVSLLPMLVFGVASGAAFACTLATYYLTYELLHLAYHSPPDSWLGSLPGVAFLRRHHQVHHSQALMGKFNFNITFPIADWLFGTTYDPARHGKQ